MKSQVLPLALVGLLLATLGILLVSFALTSEITISVRPLMLMAGGFLIMASLDQMSRIWRTNLAYPFEIGARAERDTELLSYKKFPASDVTQRIRRTRQGEFAFFGLTIAYMPTVLESLFEAAKRGCRVRILLPDPDFIRKIPPPLAFRDRTLEYLVGTVETCLDMLLTDTRQPELQDYFEVRLVASYPTMGALSLGDSVLFSPYLAGTRFVDASVLEVHARSSPLHERLIDDFETHWQSGVTPDVWPRNKKFEQDG